ncbi:Hypothetical protein NTJ_07226 [Nesidiocoris tenuis]|uniref:Uncharacterized protein n=1 Tax=Nesidiocoris tenuis TaxID=355587 RepID=A0ABN7AVE2_9HEMI|nr:Hypothetical protein NTJ_07226 [Nesidiocoris tenuis]
MSFQTVTFGIEISSQDRSAMRQARNPGDRECRLGLARSGGANLSLPRSAMAPNLQVQKVSLRFSRRLRWRVPGDYGRLKPLGC